MFVQVLGATQPPSFALQVEIDWNSIKQRIKAEKDKERSHRNASPYRAPQGAAPAPRTQFGGGGGGGGGRSDSGGRGYGGGGGSPEYGGDAMSGGGTPEPPAAETQWSGVDEMQGGDDDFGPADEGSEEELI